LTIEGKVRDPSGSALGNVRVRVVQGKVEREAVTDDKGVFRLEGLKAGPAFVTFKAAGFEPLIQRNMELSKETVLSVVLPQRSKSGWWMVWLLVPGLLGLGFATVKDWLETPGSTKRASASPAEKRVLSDGGKKNGGASALLGNRFAIAFLSALVWVGALALLALWGGIGSLGVDELYLFDPELSFEFFVPILGFLGALIYVLDLFRRGREDIPRGTEFGMRLILGPYVAIIMVMLLGKDLELVDLTSPVGRGAIAFFSGLVVVAALQKLIESGQERLGRWRQRSRYEPSEIARAFDLSQQEDQKLRDAGLKYLLQLMEHSYEQLRSMAKEAGLDPKLISGLKRMQEENFRREKMESMERALKGCMGASLMGRLRKQGIQTLEEFALLSDKAMEGLAAEDPELDVDFLKQLLQRSKKLCLYRLEWSEKGVVP
jgi:hypothetical protein